MNSFLKYWLPVLLWIGVIFVGSTELMSMEHTSRIMAPVLRWLEPDISAEAIIHIQLFVRKAAHVAEYAILAMLLWRGIRDGTSWTPNMSLVFLMTLVVCGVFAASDEIHQSSVPSRTASLTDVMIDICGALVGLTICWILAWTIPQPRFARHAVSSEDRHPKI